MTGRIASDDMCEYYESTYGRAQSINNQQDYKIRCSFSFSIIFRKTFCPVLGGTSLYAVRMFGTCNNGSRQSTMVDCSIA